MGVTNTGLTGRLTSEGRLTRGGVWLLAGLGGCLLLAAASQWRALTLVGFGDRAAGTVTERTDTVGDQYEYQVRVAFAAASVESAVVRSLTEPRGRGRSARLHVGDPVQVAYRPEAPAAGVLIHAHESWAAAPWMLPIGLIFAAMAWYWRPRPSGHLPPSSAQ